MIARDTTISFFGKVDANANKTLISQRIGTAFAIRGVSASFAPGVNRLMNLSFFVSPDPAKPTTKRPNGTNILAQSGQVRYITGDDERKNLPIEVLFPERGYYVKIYAENNDTYEHTIDVQVAVTLFENEEKA